jgi:hypothetical protein
MLSPLYSPDCQLVGWLQPGKFLFDADMFYVAFITNGHLWSARSGRWIGPVIGAHVYDMDGRPVAWNPSEPLRTFGRPLRPMNVVRAVSPVRPQRPMPPQTPLSAPGVLGGWSAFSFQEWLVSCDPKPVEIVEEPAETSEPDVPDMFSEIQSAPSEDREVDR